MYNIERRKIVDWILYFVIVVSFYMLNIYSPFINDDYYYSFIMTDGLYSDMEYTPIESICDVWESQCWAYMNHNGRFIVHSIVQLFCGILGLKLFQFLNSLVFLLLIVGIVRIIRCQSASRMALDIIIPTMLIFLGIPKIGVTYLGNISCAVNYLWTSCATIWFIYFLLTHKNATRLSSICLFIYSMVVGSMQESFSIGISAIIVIYAMTQWTEITKARKVLMFGFVLGSIFCVCAPSNFVRFATEQGSSFSIMRIMWQCVRVGLSLRFFWIMLISVILICIFSKKRCKAISGMYWLMIGACLINGCFAALVAMTGKHQLVSIELLSILIMICLLYERCYAYLLRYKSACIILLAILYVLVYIPAVYYRHAINKGQLKIVNEALQSDRGVVVGKEYESLCMETNWFATRFTRQDNYQGFNKKGLSLWLTRGSNIHYVTSVLPEEENTIIAMCKPENRISDFVYKEAQCPFYVICVPTDKKDAIQYKVGLKPGFIGGILYSLVYGKGNHMDEKEGRITDCNNFDISGSTYAIVQDTSPIQSVKVIYTE